MKRAVEQGWAPPQLADVEAVLAADRVAGGDASRGLRHGDRWSRQGLVHRVAMRFGHVLRWVPKEGGGEWRLRVDGKWVEASEADVITLVLHTVRHAVAEPAPHFWVRTYTSADGLVAALQALKYHGEVRAAREWRP